MTTFTSAENPVLAAVREMWFTERLSHGELIETALAAVVATPLPDIIKDASPWHLDHAVKVLHRLQDWDRDE